MNLWMINWSELFITQFVVFFFLFIYCFDYSCYSIMELHPILRLFQFSIHAFVHYFNCFQFSQLFQYFWFLPHFHSLHFIKIFTKLFKFSFCHYSQFPPMSHYFQLPTIFQIIFDLFIFDKFSPPFFLCSGFISIYQNLRFSNFVLYLKFPNLLFHFSQFVPVFLSVFPVFE